MSSLRGHLMEEEEVVVVADARYGTVLSRVTFRVARRSSHGSRASSKQSHSYVCAVSWKSFHHDFTTIALKVSRRNGSSDWGKS